MDQALPRRILIVRLSHLGDVVHALPVYHALRAKFPSAELGWVIQPEFAPLVAPLPGLRRTFLFQRRGGWRAWTRLARELREFGADWAVDAQGNLKSAMATWLSRAPRRSGLARRDWREGLGARAINDFAPAAAGLHAMDRMAALAGHLGGSPGQVLDPLPQADELARGEELCDAWLPQDRNPLILALPRPGDLRSLTAGQLEQLARRLSPLLLLSGPEEAELGSRLAEQLRDDAGIRHWIGQRGLRELVGFFHAAGQRRARLIGCDSGPMHLAAACGLPVQLLAGPQDARRTGPWPLAPAGPHRAYRNPSGPSCAPCLSRSCEHDRGPVCMTEWSPEQLAQQLRQY